MNRTILHIDMNSYFASVEQQANPRLRGKPVGVTGGDRMERTVIGAASIEAKKFGVRTGMAIWQAQALCPGIILVKGDSDKYLSVTKKFLNILKDYGPKVEVFSIDEVFLELSARGPVPAKGWSSFGRSSVSLGTSSTRSSLAAVVPKDISSLPPLAVAQDIKRRIKGEIGEYVTCSIGISYNKLLAKLAGSLQKKDGLIIIPNQEEAIKVLDTVELNEICGIGYRIKKRLNNMGVYSFKDLRKVPKEALLASFKSYGQVLYDMSRGIDNRGVLPFFEKEEVKSIGHRLTLNHDTKDQVEIKQVLLKLTELIARKLRSKNLVGKTVSCWYREAFQYPTSEVEVKLHLGFAGEGKQSTIAFTQDGLEIFKAAWKIFHQIWTKDRIRMIGASISNLKPATPQNLSLLEETKKQETILKVIDKINNKYGEFVLQRGALLGSSKIRRKPNPFSSDYRFKV